VKVDTCVCEFDTNLDTSFAVETLVDWVPRWGRHGSRADVGVFRAGCSWATKERPRLVAVWWRLYWAWERGDITLSMTSRGFARCGFVKSSVMFVGRTLLFEQYA